MRLTTTAWLTALMALAGCGTPQSSPANGSEPAANEQAAVTETVAPSETAVVDEAQSGNAAEPVANTADGGATLPADVVAFQAKRDDCDHFRGEEPTDPARAAFLEKALERTCKGTDAQLTALRKRYADTPAVITALADYEDGIE